MVIFLTPLPSMCKPEGNIFEEGIPFTMFPVVNTFQMHSIVSKIWCIGVSEGLSFFQQSLMEFFMRISKLFSKKVHYPALMSKNEVLYDQNHIRSFKNMVFG